MAKKKKTTAYKPPKNSSKGFIMAIGGIFVLVAVLLIIIGNQDSAQNDGDSNHDSTSGTQLDVTYEGQPTVGDKDAPVKLVEFFDFKCPHCAVFAQQVYPKIKKDFIDTGKANMTFINKPFLAPDSITAASVGEAVFKQKPDAFLTYYDAVLENQGDMQENWATEKFLIGLIEENVEGIDLDQLKKDIDSDSVKDEVERDREMSAQVESTPTILVNGKKVELDYEASIKPAIEKALEEANGQ